MLFTYNNNQASKIREINFSTEKELQCLCEENLELLLNLEFVATEFSVANFRIDTLAYDKEANAFIIIEYKNTKIQSVIDQGYSYLSTMLNNKADFVLKFSQKKGKIYEINNINWEQSKILFVSPLFTTYQLGAINFKDLPIELWKIKKFENKTFLLEQVNSAENQGGNRDSRAKITEIMPITKDSNSAIKEIKTYSEEELINVARPEIQDIYQNLKEFILSEKEDIVVKATKLYVGFYKNRNCLVSIQIQQKSLLMWINEKFTKIDDPKKLFRDVSCIGHYGNGECEIKIQDNAHIGYIQDIIKKFLQDKG